jgi:hypothetical protein
VLVDVASRAGGRRTTPCMAGNVRVLVVTGPDLGDAGVVAACGACGPSATGTGLTATGRGSAMVGFGLSGAGGKGGGSSGSGRGFQALKKMSGQCMVVRSCAQFQGIWMNLGKMRGLRGRIAVMRADLSVEAIQKQDRLFSWSASKNEAGSRPFWPWHITCLSVIATVFCPFSSVT